MSAHVLLVEDDPVLSQTLVAELSVQGHNVTLARSCADAVALLNGALASKQPTLFLYPKAMLNLAAFATSADVEKHFALPGSGVRRREGRDLTLVVWGNTLPLALEDWIDPSLLPASPPRFPAAVPTSLTFADD